ncbi:MAG: hypothetical protein WC284_13460 [Candidimonas sp.]
MFFLRDTTDPYGDAKRGFSCVVNSWFDSKDECVEWQKKHFIGRDPKDWNGKWCGDPENGLSGYAFNDRNSFLKALKNIQSYISSNRLAIFQSNDYDIAAGADGEDVFRNSKFVKWINVDEPDLSFLKENRIYYHVTDKKFDKFDNNYTGQVGFHFSRNPERFKTHGNFVVKAKLNFSKPANLDKWREALNIARGGNPRKMAIEYLKNQGYDAVETSYETIVFEPEQIEIINEKKEEHVINTSVYGTEVHVMLFVNPTPQELINYGRKMIFDEFRGFLFNGDVYIFDAYYATHDDVYSYLTGSDKFVDDKITFSLYYNKTGEKVFTFIPTKTFKAFSGNQIIKKLIQKTRKSSLNEINDKNQYLYHGTSEGAFRRIREEGLKIRNGKIYFSDSEKYSTTYSKRKGSPFGIRILRVIKNDNFIEDESTGGGDYISIKNINPSDIEVKTSHGWIPIQQYYDENIGIMQIS